MIRWLLTTFVAVAVLSSCWPWLRKIGIGRMPGDVTLRIDEGIGVRYRINTISGVAHLDGTTIVRGSMGKAFTHQTASLEGRWLDMSANSVSGNLSVVRRSPSSGSATDAAKGAA